MHPIQKSGKPKRLAKACGPLLHAPYRAVGARGGIMGPAILKSVNPISTRGADYTGKSMSEDLIFASTNPHYDNRLFIEL